MIGFPRRCCVDQMTPAELAIREAKRVVEEAGCDVHLTNAIVLLSQAQECVADFVDVAISNAKIATMEPKP